MEDEGAAVDSGGGELVGDTGAHQQVDDLFGRHRGPSSRSGTARTHRGQAPTQCAATGSCGAWAVSTPDGRSTAVKITPATKMQPDTVNAVV